MEFKEVITKRRSVNFFDPSKDVSEQLLKEIIELSANTPSSFNLQPWSAIVVRDQPSKEKLKEAAWGQPKVSEAPVTLIVLADKDGWKEGHTFFEKNYNEMLKEGSMTQDKRQWFLNATKNLYGSDGDRQLAFACKNTGFFAMSLMLSAKSLGVDTHPMDGFDSDAVRKIFNISDNYWIALLIAFGYFSSDKILYPPKWRKNYNEIIIKR